MSEELKAPKTPKNRISKNGDGDELLVTHKMSSVEIPPLALATSTLLLVGDRPLMVNNKCAAAQDIDDIYNQPGGKASAVKKPKLSQDELYARAFYVMADSKFPAPHPKGSYGIPASGIKKCACKAIRTTGITDNTTIGLLSNSFWVMSDVGYLCRLEFERLERDVRPVNIGSGAKTVPQMRHRPMFHGWRLKLQVKYNEKVLSPEQLVNLFMHAGQYIGLCELRAEKKQGECGGFVVGNTK